MSSIVEMATNVFTTSSTGVTTCMPFLHQYSRGASPDSLLTVSGGLSKTGALVTPDPVDSSGRNWASSSSTDLVISSGRDVVISSVDVVISSWDVVINSMDSSGMDVAISSGKDVISSGRDVISSGRDVVSSGRDVISKGRDMISSGRVSQGRS